MLPNQSLSPSTAQANPPRPPSAAEIAQLFALGEHELAKGRLAEALIVFRFIRALDPDHVDASARYALTLFRREQWAEAWDAFDVRFKLMPAAPRVSMRGPDGSAIDVPRWRGGPPPRRLLVMDEQGLGDTINFVRFLKPLEAQGVDVTFVTHSILFDLIRSMGVRVNLLPSDRPGSLPGIDGWTPLLYLPKALSIDPATYAAAVPYLRPDSVRVEKWAKRIGPKGFKIGIAWAGNPDSPADKGRSCPLEQFEPLAAMEGVRLFSLQKGAAAKDLAKVSFRRAVTDFGKDLDQGDQAFLDTAALMESLDLIVTVDTAVAHLAGALGRPVDILLRKDPDWRWLARESDTVWYPSATLYRQTVSREWRDPIARMVRAIALRMGEAPGAATEARSALVPVSLGELADRKAVLALRMTRGSTVEERAEAAIAHDALVAEWQRLSVDYPALREMGGDVAELRAEEWAHRDAIAALGKDEANAKDILARTGSLAGLEARRRKLIRAIDRTLLVEAAQEKIVEPTQKRKRKA